MCHRIPRIPILVYPRVGVCLDTCHLFASGYDIRDQDAYNETMKKFSEIVGLDYLSAFHLNDSKVSDFMGHGRQRCIVLTHYEGGPSNKQGST